MFASMAGFLLSLFVLVLILIGIAASMVSSLNDGESVSISDNTILQITFESAIKERTDKNPLSGLDFSGIHNDKTPGLDEILKSLTKAKSDDRIKGILLELTGIEAGMATTEEIRNALLDFKKSGKFIYAYGESYSQKAYYLASTANKLYFCAFTSFPATLHASAIVCSI